MRADQKVPISLMKSGDCILTRTVSQSICFLKATWLEKCWACNFVCSRAMAHQPAVEAAPIDVVAVEHRPATI